MVIKSDQEYVRSLLSEAVRVLCKDRLTYKTQLNIEGLIGITLDSDDIFLVNIKETVVKEEEEEDEEEGEKDSDSVMSNSVNNARPGRQRKSMPRHLSMVASPPHIQDQEDSECSWQLANGTDIEDISPLDLIQVPSKKDRSQSESPQLWETGEDAPLNLSSSSHKEPGIKRERQNLNEEPENLAPIKRKRIKSEDSESIISLTKRPLSASTNMSPNSISPIPPMIPVKQEFNHPVYPESMYDSSSLHQNGLYPLGPFDNRALQSVPNNNHKESLYHQPLKERSQTPTRTSHLDSIIWQRLSSSVSPIHMSTPLTQSQANYVCPVCGRHMQHLGGWTRHVERCGTPRFCHICGKQFKTSNSLRVHRFHYHRNIQNKSSSKKRSPKSNKTYSTGNADPTEVDNSAWPQIPHLEMSIKQEVETDT